jgi:N,N'-diacetyllegionaminate synthase
MGDRTVGPGQPCLLVAEIGINHNGDLDLARRAIDAAASAGADAVKFQNYRTEDFVQDRALTYEYVSQGRRVVESQYDMFKRCELTRNGLAALKAHSDGRGVLFFSTPTSEEGIADLLAIGVPVLKNGSDYLTHLPLIAAMARTGKPTLLSTGMSTLDEIDDAVRAFRDAGGRDLVVLHCTSAYPTPPGEVHLRTLPMLAERFACPVGLSDHTDGIVAAIGAVALGACVVEKHFTVDKTLPGPDHSFSADPEEFAQLARSVRTLECSLGEVRTGPTPAEARGREEYRLSCVTRRALPARHVLEEADWTYSRPGTGLPPKVAHRLAGRMLKRSVPAGHPLSFEDLD